MNKVYTRAEFLRFGGKLMVQGEKPVKQEKKESKHKRRKKRIGRLEN